MRGHGGKEPKSPESVPAKEMGWVDTRMSGTFNDRYGRMEFFDEAARALSEMVMEVR